jgi:hypothetical protein
MDDQDDADWAKAVKGQGPDQKQAPAELRARAPGKRHRTQKQQKRKQFAYVPLPWGYRAITIAGRGGAIVLHALRMQEAGLKRKDVPITDKLLKEWGLDPKTRSRTLARLEAAGLATVRRRGKFRGCPLLTLHYR